MSHRSNRSGAGHDASIATRVARFRNPQARAGARERRAVPTAPTIVVRSGFSDRALRQEPTSRPEVQLAPFVRLTSNSAEVSFCCRPRSRSRQVVRRCVPYQGEPGMDASRFDGLAKSLATATGRRTAAKVLVGGALGAVGVTALTAKPAAAACRRRHRPCNRDGQCCSDCCKNGQCRRRSRCN
jgi:hypothetical protein